MGKRLFLLLIVSMVGIVSSSTALTATDFVDLTGLDNTNVVETVPLPEPELVVEEVQTAGTPKNTTYNAPVAGYAAIPANNIQINGKTIELAYTGSTGENAGAATKAWYYSSGKYIYGHNYDHVFGSLDAAYDRGQLGGMVFSITFNGVTSNYIVANYRVYDYNPNSPYNVYYNGQAIEGYTFAAARMKNASGVAADAYVQGRDDAFYDLALMTCYAGSSKRLVIFANRV